MDLEYLDEELARHDVSRREVDDVLRHPMTIEVDMKPSDRNNPRIMFIGFTANLRLLEIGIEYFENGREQVFHADDVTPQYRQEFEKAWQ